VLCVIGRLRNRGFSSKYRGEAMCPVQSHLRLKARTTFMDAGSQSAGFPLSFKTGFAFRFKTGFAAGFEARFCLSFQNWISPCFKTGFAADFQV